ncbi:AAA family ATPase [Mucilaginibacter sp.]|uniref:ATP-dependent nuclease n=1 Tax=Mucilaginibacter sp. TaxID=1882438 RepID=UPI0025E8163E|nr:AAA family ATPase [Mucilaginibacter sp.]
MYICNLKIKNFRNFGDPFFEIPLKPFTLIIGENNIGKTNLLNAIGLIFGQDIMAAKKRTLEIDDFNYQAVKHFKKQVANPKIPVEDIKFPEVSIEATMCGFEPDQAAVVGDWFIDRALTQARITYLYAIRSDWVKKSEWIIEQRKQLQDKVDAISKSESGKEFTEDQRISNIDFPIDYYEYRLYGGDDLTNRCDPYYLRMLKMEFLDALRDAKRELIASGDYRLLYKILCRKDLAGYSSIKSILETLEDEIKGNTNLKSIQSEVSILLEKVSLYEDGADHSIGFSFSSPETFEILKKIGLTYGSNPISVDRNGLGRNNLLYISLVLSQITGKHVNGDYTSFRVIGIEEAEAHLHPLLQSHLAENIEATHVNKDSQLLLTSHSTHITGKLSLENSVVLFKDLISGEIKCHYLLDKLDVLKEAQSIAYLEKYLDATKSCMFFSRKVILVEGISEQILLPVLYKRHKNVTFEKIGCSVINVNGVAFSHFLKVVKNGFFVKCLVLTDSDTNKRTENRANNLKSEFSSPVILVEKSDKSQFEKDLIDSNKNGSGKAILLSALIKTKPTNGKAFEQVTGTNDIDVETFFSEIEQYKSEFSFNLSKELSLKTATFILPSYIIRGLDFIG